jgi:hypothetical protein
MDQTFLNGGGTALTGFRILGSLGNGHMGSAPSLGDINGDGYDDILVFATLADQGATNTGSAYLVYGKASGWSGTQSVTDVWLAGSGGVPNGFRLDGEAAENTIGQEYPGVKASAIGDTNRDGKADMAILSRSRPNNTLAGSAYVVFGRSPNKWQTTQSLADLLN